jgi:hypothetical protein
LQFEPAAEAAGHQRKEMSVPQRNSLRPSLALALFAALALAGCTAGLPEEVAKCGYVNRDKRFALDVPPGWTVRETAGTTAVLLLAPGRSDVGRPNVNVTVVREGGTLRLEHFAVECVNSLGRLPGFELISQGPTATAALQTAYLATFRESSAGTPVMQRQLYLVAGDRGYIVSAAARPEAFADYEDAFDLCFRSFRAGW